MIRPHKSRGNTAGIAIVAVLISAVVFLGIIIAITGTLSLSSRQSTGDQRVTLEAQYASESGLSRVMADAQGGYLKTWTELLFRLVTPNTTQESEIKALAVKFCNLPATTVFNASIGCTANNSAADVAGRYEVFSNYLKPADYAAVTMPSGVTAPTTTPQENAFWSDVFSDGPSGKRFTQTVSPNVKYDVSFGFEAQSVNVVGGNYQFRVRPRDAVSTGIYQTSGQVAATRSSSRTFQDAYIIELRPPSFAYFLSLTNTQEQANADPNQPSDKIYFDTTTLLNGPVHTNGKFNFKGTAWFSDTVSSAGCTDSTNAGTCTPSGNYDSNQALTFDGSGNPIFPGYTVPGSGAAPEFVGQNFDNPILRTTYTPNGTNPPWNYKGRFNAGVVNFPTSSNDQRDAAIAGGILLPAGVLTPAEAALTVTQRPVYPQITLQATADNFDPNATTTTTFDTINAGTSATAERKQLIRIVNREQLNNCRAAPTGITISPPTALINYGSSQNYTAVVIGQDNYTYTEAPTEKKVTTWNATSPVTVTGGVAGTGNLTATYSTSSGYAMNPSITITATAGLFSDTATLQVQATTPNLTFSASPNSFPYGGGVSTLSWSSVGTGPFTYKIEKSVDGGSSYLTLVASTTDLSLSVTSDITSLYRITATGPTGLVDTDSATVTVAAPVSPKVILSSSPSSLPYGGPSTTLSWTVTGSYSAANPITLKLTNNQNATVTTVTGMTGSLPVPITETTRYFLTATGPGGTDSDYEDVTVALPVAPNFTFNASPTSLPYGGGNSTLTWSAASGTPSVSYAMTTTVGGVTSGPSAIAGSTTVGDTQSFSPTVTTTYNITATGPGGSKTISRTVTVAPPIAPTVILTTSTSTFAYGGGATTLGWSSSAGTGPITYQVDGSTDGGTTWSNIKPANSPSGTQLVNLTATTRYRVIATGGTGLTATDSKDVTVSPPDPPAFTLTASPTNLPYLGGNSTLNWSGATGTGVITYQLEQSTNAGGTWTTLIGAGSSTTTYSASPTVTTRYRVTATGKVGASVVGTTPKTVDVTVAGPTSPLVSIARNPASGTLVNGNNSTVLSWSLTNTPSPTVTYQLEQKIGAGAWTTILGPSSSATSQTVTNLTATTLYRVTASSSAPGTVVGQSSLTLTVGSVGTPPNITSFVANPNSSTTTVFSTLSWTIINATNATMTRVSGTGTVPPATVNSVSGSTGVTVPSTTYYELTAINAFGETKKQVVVYIGTGTAPTVILPPPPVINLFTATPPNLAYGGGASDLAWNISNADAASIDQGVGPVNKNSGIKGVTVPNATTSYVLSATNAGGTAKQTVTVTVAAAVVPTVMLNVPTPTYAYGGGTQTISWSASGTAPFTYQVQKSINGGSTWTDVIAAGSSSLNVSVTTTQTTVYRAIAVGPGGTGYSINKTVTVNPAIAPTVTLTPSPTALPYGGGTTNLSWSTTGTAPITYKLESSNNGGSTWNTLIAAGSSATSLSNVAMTTTTQFRVTATNVAGTNPDTKTVTVAAATPPTPTLLIAPNNFPYLGGNSNLSWGVSAGTGPTFTYQLDKSINGTTWINVIAAGSSATSLSNVNSGVSTQYRITATGIGGTGTVIQNVSVAPAVAPTVVLTAPTSTLPYGGGIAALSWNTSAGTGPFTYQLEASTNGGTTWNTLLAAGSSATTYNANLTDTTVYRVTASGPTSLQGSDQKTVNVTPATPPTLTFNGSPLSHAFGGGASNLTWSATGTGTMGYLLEQSTNGGTSWTSIAMPTTTTSRTVNPTVTTVYRVTATGGTGLKDDKTVTVTVGAPIAPTITSMAATANLPAGGGNSTVTWAATGTAPITYKLEKSTNGGTSFTTVIDNSSSTSEVVAITTTTLFRLTATNPGGSVSAQKTTTVAPPPEALMSLNALGPVLSIKDQATATAFDPGWSVTPTFSNTTGGAVPTVIASDYVVTIAPANAGDTALTATVVNNAGKIGLSLNRLPSGTPSRTYTVTISLTKNSVTKTASFTITLTKNSNYTMLRPRARLTQTTSCAFGGPVAYTWPVFTDYMVLENGDIYMRKYASTQQASAVAENNPTALWVKQPKKFNGVIYADGPSGIRGPTRTNLSDPATGYPAVASFAKLTLASASDIVINGDLKYESPVCNTSPVRGSDQKVTPATCETDSSKWKKNVLGIYTSGGNVNIRTQVVNQSTGTTVALPNLAIQAVTMASQGRVEVEGVLESITDPACPALLDNTVSGNLGSINIQGGLIQKSYGAFARTDESLSTDPSWCGYDRTMTYDTRMREPERAPPSFPTADNAEWKTNLYLASDTVNALSAGTILPLTQGFSRNK